MTALIADTSPILRNIPSDPPADHRHSFEFSPSPMPGRYLSEGNNQDARAHSPHGYNPREVPTLYAQHYGYTMAGAFAHHNPGAPARLAVKSCRCQRPCSCNISDSKTAQQQQHQQQQQLSSSESQRSMWRNNDSNSTIAVTARPDLFHGETSAHSMKTGLTVVSLSSAPSRSPSPSAVLAQHRRDSRHVMPTIELGSSSSTSASTSTPKKSDWENLLGAVDLELRAQERAELVPDSASTTSLPTQHHYTHAINAAHQHHRDSHIKYAQQQQQHQHQPQLHHRSAAASVSPEFGPVDSTPRHHHRRGAAMDSISGGEPAYSGTTADAACLLVTLPQRMLDRVSQHHQPASTAPAPAAGAGGGCGGVAVPLPALVSASGPPVTPVRVQASGRRGPRGQSRFKGVCITRAGKWRAVIYIGRKQKYLGVFDSEFDAARAYDAAALQHFAEGAKLNFPDGIEQQLNDLSSGGGGRPFATAGAGGAAAPRSSTPPAFLETPAAAAADTGAASSGRGKRSRRSAFGEHDEDQWVREAPRQWSNSSRI
ncbi:unnamed protein product [Pylaiella littoralis]